MSDHDENDLRTNYNVHDHLKNLSVAELKAITDADRLPYAVASFNVDGNLNIGIMIRNAVLMGAERFIVFGKRQYDRRSCVGSYHYINIDNVGGMDHRTGEFNFDAYRELMETYNYLPVYIETGGQYLDSGRDIVSETINSYGKKPCFVFGSESNGLPKELLIGADEILSLPQLGPIRSFNVSAAAAIVMWTAMSNFGRYK